MNQPKLNSFILLPKNWQEERRDEREEVKEEEKHPLHSLSFCLAAFFFSKGEVEHCFKL